MSFTDLNAGPLHKPAAAPQKPKEEPEGPFDAEQELLKLRRQAKTLYETIEHDDDTPANQKAQVLNSISSVLQALVKLQADVHSTKKVQAIELAVIAVMKRQPQPVYEAFLHEYEAELAKL